MISAQFLSAILEQKNVCFEILWLISFTIQSTEAELQSLLERTQPATSAASAERRSYKCRKCGQPKRGHRVCPYDNNESEN